MSPKKPASISVAVFLVLSSTAAFAYIGPGLGAGAVASVLGILFGPLLLVVGIVWYPMKRLIQFLRKKKQ